MLQSWAGTLHYDDSVMSRRSSLWLFNNEQVHFITLMQSWAYAVHYYANMSRRTSLWWCKHEQAHFIMMMQSWADAIIMMLQSWPSALHYDGAIMTKHTSLWWCNHYHWPIAFQDDGAIMSRRTSLWCCSHDHLILPGFRNNVFDSLTNPFMDLGSIIFMVRYDQCCGSGPFQNRIILPDRTNGSYRKLSYTRLSKCFFSF